MTGAEIRWHSAGIDQVPADDAWLDPALAGRLAAMPYAKRYDEARLGRWTAKSAVGRALGFHQDDLDALRRVVIVNAPDGAPEVLVDGAPATVQIAMTDRADWAVCALRSGSRVGCDLELVEPRSEAFIDDYLTAAEQTRVRGATDRDFAANLIWSAKESTLKVLRTGLRKDTRTVEVSVDAVPSSEWQPLSVKDDRDTRYPGWWIRYGEFILTVVGSGPSSLPPVALTEPPPLAGAAPSHRWMERPLRHRAD